MINILGGTAAHLSLNAANAAWWIWFAKYDWCGGSSICVDVGADVAGQKLRLQGRHRLWGGALLAGRFGGRYVD